MERKTIQISILKPQKFLCGDASLECYIQTTLPYLSVLNNGCVHRREFSDFSKIFSSQGSYKVPFPQNKYFVKLTYKIVLFQATTAFFGIVVLLTHRQVNTSQNALDLQSIDFALLTTNIYNNNIQVRFFFWLFSLVTHILHNTLETFYIV